MPLNITSTSITGVSVSSNSDDVANKSYVDTRSGAPAVTGNEAKFLYSSGTSATWELIGATQEYTTAGSYTFNIPTQAKELLIEFNK